MYLKLFFVSFLCIEVLITFSVCKPNVVLILTDDQDEVLGGMTPLSRTHQLITKQGAAFVNSFTATPVCCPSRSSMLTGKYPHNHHTINNTVSGGCSGPLWQNASETNTFAAILNREASYKTFYAGKYLNEYGHKQVGGPQHVPAGWTTWRGLVGNSVYYNFTLSHDGRPVAYHQEEYLTDVIKDLALEFIQNVADSKEPFLMVLSPPAPHAPFTPAPRHKDRFKTMRAPRTPNFNVPAGKDKHWLMHMYSTPLSDSTLDLMDDIFRSRWETLLAVDEMVEEVIKALRTRGLDDNTYYILTSDNGFHIGQFAQPYDKRLPYETDIRVPLVVRGPGVTPGLLSSSPAMNIDIAPTILKLAGVTPPQDMDGVPLTLSSSYSGEDSVNEVKSDGYEREMLIEYSGEGSDGKFQCPFEDPNLFGCDPEFECRCQDARNNTYSCVRHLHSTIDHLYCSFQDSTGTDEFYNMMLDPHQSVNIIGHVMPAIKYKYQNNMQHLMQCSGINCNQFNH